MEQNNDHDKNTEKFIRMTTQPVEKLIAKLAVPTIISMLMTSFYNLADTFFVRQLENDSMVAAVGVVLPLMTLIQAFGFFCGHGSGNYISRAYGKQDYKDAETMAATGFCYAVLFGLIISYRFRPRFRICGATAVSRLVFQSEFFYKVKQRKTISEYDGLSLCIIYNILK